MEVGEEGVGPRLQTGGLLEGAGRQASGWWGGESESEPRDAEGAESFDCFLGGGVGGDAGGRVSCRCYFDEQAGTGRERDSALLVWWKEDMMVYGNQIVLQCFGRGII